MAVVLKFPLILTPGQIALIRDAFDEYGEVHSFVYGFGSSWGLTEIGKIPTDDLDQLGKHYVYFVGGRIAGRVVQIAFIALGVWRIV